LNQKFDTFARAVNQINKNLAKVVSTFIEYLTEVPDWVPRVQQKVRSKLFEVYLNTDSLRQAST
jgi:SPX domain protein involved in polyphosphate accumulation